MGDAGQWLCQPQIPRTLLEARTPPLHEERWRVGLTKLQITVRKTGITASELGAILGLSAFSGPLEVWESKMGRGTPVEVSSAMKVGTMLEEAIAYRIEKETGALLTHATEIEKMFAVEDTAIHLGDGTFRSKRFPRLIVTPDYLGTKWKDGYPLDPWAEEIKCVGRWSGANLFSPPSASKARYPESYAVQVVAQVGTLGLAGGRLWALVQNSSIPDKEIDWLYQESLGDNREHFMWWARGYVSRQSLRSYEIPYKVERFEELGEAVTKFWVDHVETGKKDPAWRPVKRITNNKPAPATATEQDDGWGENPEEF